MYKSVHGRFFGGDEREARSSGGRPCATHGRPARSCGREGRDASHASRLRRPGGQAGERSDAPALAGDPPAGSRRSPTDTGTATRGQTQGTPCERDRQALMVASKPSHAPASEGRTSRFVGRAGCTARAGATAAPAAYRRATTAPLRGGSSLRGAPCHATCEGKCHATAAGRPSHNAALCNRRLPHGMTGQNGRSVHPPRARSQVALTHPPAQRAAGRLAAPPVKGARFPRSLRVGSARLARPSAPCCQPLRRLRGGCAAPPRLGARFSRSLPLPAWGPPRSRVPAPLPPPARADPAIGANHMHHRRKSEDLRISDKSETFGALDSRFPKSRFRKSRPNHQNVQEQSFGGPILRLQRPARRWAPCRSGRPRLPKRIKK